MELTFLGGTGTFGDFWGDDKALDGSRRGSWQDTTRDWYVSGEDPWTTFRYAGFIALFAMELNKVMTFAPYAFGPMKTLWINQ